MNWLFVCSRNEWRSRTAESIFKNRQGVSVRSVGTSATARRRIQAGDLDWADQIFVMEPQHRNRIREQFGRGSDDKIIVLHIEDDYPYMDSNLVAMLEDMLLPYFPA